MVETQKQTAPVTSTVVSSTPTIADLMAQIELAKAENARLVAEKAEATKLRLEVTDKGGISIYNPNSRFPLTPYVDFLLRILDEADNIRAFVKANRELIDTRSAANIAARKAEKLAAKAKA